MTRSNDKPTECVVQGKWRLHIDDHDFEAVSVNDRFWWAMYHDFHIAQTHDDLDRFNKSVCLATDEDRTYVNALGFFNKRTRSPKDWRRWRAMDFDAARRLVGTIVPMIIARDRPLDGPDRATADDLFLVVCQALYVERGSNSDYVYSLAVSTYKNAKIHSVNDCECDSEFVLRCGDCAGDDARHVVWSNVWYFV